MKKEHFGLLILVAMVILSSLACLGSVHQAPEYELRGWTVTPSSTASPDPTEARDTPTPVVIFITATYEVHTVEVITDALEVRSGPSENSPSVGFIVKGDVVEVAECVVDDNGEVWAHVVSPLDGWSAVTWGNRVFIKPLPRC